MTGNCGEGRGTRVPTLQMSNKAPAEANNQQQQKENGSLGLSTLTPGSLQPVAIALPHQEGPLDD